MRCRTTGALMMLGLAMTLALSGCAEAAPTADDRVPTTTPNVTVPGEGAAGTRLAAGLYDQPDGTVLAIGTLEWNDLEGGFWAIVGGTQATGDAGTIVAVIPAVTRNDPAYANLAGKTVQITGERIKGASIRSAGPEVKVTSVSEITDTPGVAD